MGKARAKLDDQQLAARLVRAARGKDAALHRAVLAAGYRLPWWAATRSEAARFFGISTKTLDEWCAAREAPGAQSKGSGRRKPFDLRELTAWRIARAGEAAAGNGHDPKAERAKWEAKLAELKYRRAMEELIEVSRLEAEILARSGAFVAALRSLPAALAVAVAGKAISACRTIIEEECRRIQAEMFGELED